jgi:hypothetical protein
MDETMDTQRPDAPRPTDISAAALRRQMAALAEQVRQLGNRVERTGEQAPAEQVVVAPPPPAPRPRAAGPIATDPLLVEVIGMAERAAESIRAAARREAEQIRAAPVPALDADGEILAALERQREALGTLAAQADRIEQELAALRGQAAVLDGERMRMWRALGAP